MKKALKRQLGAKKAEKNRADSIRTGLEAQSTDQQHRRERQKRREAILADKVDLTILKEN